MAFVQYPSAPGHHGGQQGLQRVLGGGGEGGSLHYWISFCLKHLPFPAAASNGGLSCCLVERLQTFTVIVAII